MKDDIDAVRKQNRADGEYVMWAEYIARFIPDYNELGTEGSIERVVPGRVGGGDVSVFHEKKIPGAQQLEDTDGKWH